MPKEVQKNKKRCIMGIILQENIGKQHCLLFVGSNLGFEIFLKKMRI